MNRKFAYIIPTCDRPELIQEFCDTAAYYYKDFFDIYICDSSKSDATELVCEKYKYIRHIRFSNDIGLPKKVFDTMNDFSKREEYSYVWLATDAIRYKEKGIRHIVSALDPEVYDMILLDYFRHNAGDDIYDDVDPFYQDCIWMTPLLGSVILKRSSMLYQWDEDFYRKIFCDSEIMNWSINFYYFHKASMVEKFKAIRLNTNEQYVYSHLKKRNYWRKDAFPIYCEEWPKVFDLLPDCYTNKDKVLRQSAYDAIIGGKAAYVKLRWDGIYSLKEFIKYRKVWKRISYLKNSTLLSVALTPPFICRLPYVCRSRVLLYRIKQLEKKYKTVIVYGTGAYGYKFSEYAQLHQIKIDMYCTSKKKGQGSFRGYPVVGFDELKEFENIGVILAMLPGNCKEVLRNLRTKMGEDQIVLIDKHTSESVEFDLGYRLIGGNASM